MLGIPNAGLVNGGAAKLFIAFAFGTGAFGLFIGGMMEYRANAIGGTLRVESTEGRGTSVTCRVPHKR